MARRIARPLSIAVLAAAAAACRASAPSRFYTLDSLAAADGAPPASYTVAVGPVSIPASVDRAQFVVQVAPNRVEIDEFNRWVAPLDDSVARAVAGNLVTLLGTPDVAATPLANFAPTYRVTIAVQRFDSMPGDAVLVDAMWTVRAAADGATRSGRTVAREPVQGASYDGLAAAHSRALATVSGDIAAAIRVQAEHPGAPGVAR
jgi:hypothetical protein